MSELKETFEKIVNEYVKLFAEKQDMELDLDYWVAGDIGGIINICDYFFNFDEIRYDINNKIKKGVIVEYYNYIIDNHDPEDTGYDYIINYPSYCKGARYPENKKQ